MSKTHWKKLHNPDYLGAYALEPGQDLIVTIKSVTNELVMGADGKKEECMVMRFSDGTKPMIVNVTNAKAISKLMGSEFIEDWAGKKIQLFVDKVKAFGEVVEALRIRKALPKEAKSSNPIPCVDCGQVISAYKTMADIDVAQYAIKKYGRAVCLECGQKIAAAAEGAELGLSEPEGSTQDIPALEQHEESNEPADIEGGAK